MLDSERANDVDHDFGLAHLLSEQPRRLVTIDTRRCAQDRNESAERFFKLTPSDRLCQTSRAQAGRLLESKIECVGDATPASRRAGGGAFPLSAPLRRGS